MPKVTIVKFLGSNGLFCFISICKCGGVKKPFATITSLSELYFRIRKFMLLVQTKNFYELWQQHKQLKTMEMSEATWYFLWGILYINSNLTLTKFTSSSSRSTKLKNILPWKISIVIHTYYMYVCICDMNVYILEIWFWNWYTLNKLKNCNLLLELVCWSFYILFLSMY